AASHAATGSSLHGQHFNQVIRLIMALPEGPGREALVAEEMRPIADSCLLPGCDQQALDHLFRILESQCCSGNESWLIDALTCCLDALSRNFPLEHCICSSAEQEAHKESWQKLAAGCERSEAFSEGLQRCEELLRQRRLALHEAEMLLGSPESEAGRKAEAAAELRAQLREEMAAESKRLEAETLRPMEAESIRLEQEVNRLHARSRELRAEMDAVSLKFVDSRERQRAHMGQVDGWRTDFYQVKSSKSQSQQEVDSQAELANQRKQMCSDLISAVTLLTSSQTIPAITGSHQASLHTEVVQAEKDHKAVAVGLREAAEARLTAAAADVRDWQKEDARAVAELQLLGVGCAESQLPTRSQLPSLVEQLRVACAGFRQAEIAAAGACAKSSNVSAALLLAETEDLLIELLQKVPPELAALAAANRSSTCDAPVVSSMASASSRSFTAGGMQASTAAVRPARSGPSPIATSLFSDLDENRPFTPISSPLGGGAGISKPARVQLASCRLEEKLVAEGDQLKAGDFAGLMALAEEAAAGQVPTGPNAVSEPKDLELRTRLEEVMEARGKGVMTQELKNATTILGRLMQDMSNTKLHEMRRDVLLRTVGEDLLFVFESAGFREGQRKEGGASFVWHGSDTPLLLRVAVHEDSSNTQQSQSSAGTATESATSWGTYRQGRRREPQAWQNFTTSHEGWWDDRWGIEPEDPDGEDTYNDNYYQPPRTQPWQDRDVKDFKDRVKPPEFDGIVEDTPKGDGVRNYLRRLEIREELTTVPKKKHAIVLFYKLRGRAWTDAETLDIKELQEDHGMDIYKAWVRQKYRELEITTIGDNMKEFFRNLHLKKGQSVREFNNEFDRLWKKLSGMGCGLPTLALAWYYLYKLMIADQQEATLLSSVGNEYELEKHTDQGRSNWKDGRNKQRNVNMTDQPAEGGGSSYSDETSSDDEDSDVGELEEDAAATEHEAYVTMQTAKMKLGDTKNLRSFRGGGKGGGKGDKDYQKKIDERLQKAKEQSLSSRCKQKGHWHKDEVCPLNGGSGAAGAGSSKPRRSHYTAHVAFMAENLGNTRAGPVPFLPVGAANPEVPWSTMAAGPEPFQPLERLRPGMSLEQQDEFITYMSGALGEGGKYYGIADTACSKMVAGMPWHRAFRNNVNEAGYVITEVQESEGFKFGASRTHRSTFAAITPMAIGGKILVVRVSIVPCDVPLLLSRPALEALDMHIHLAGRTADFGALDLRGVNEWPQIRVLLSRDMYAADGREVRLCAVYNKSDEVDVATYDELIRIHVSCRSSAYAPEKYQQYIAEQRFAECVREKQQVQYITCEHDNWKAHGEQQLSAWFGRSRFMQQRIHYGKHVLEAENLNKDYARRTRLFRPPHSPVMIFAMAELRPVSYMMKNELLEELCGYGADVNPAWTQQELRVVTREERLDRGLAKAKDGVKLPTKKGDLIKMCSEEGLVIGPKATCATMRLLLRDFLEAQISGGAVINFGKYDGHTYDELKEKQPGYLAWVIKTADENKDCSRALQTLASWGARHQEKAPGAATTLKPEKSSTTPSQKPKENTNQRRQREDPEEEAKMDAEPPEETLEAIQELETRLAVLRQKNGIRTPGPPPGTNSSGASSWRMATSLPGLGESILAGTHSEVEDGPEEGNEDKPRAKATKARPIRTRRP
ncbi:unnamed protein product, partial [Polarella glacialis]